VPALHCAARRRSGPREWSEGYLDERGHIEAEGPYGEFLGYYGGVKHESRVHLTAVTRRRDALFQTPPFGGRNLARTDTAQLNALRTEVKWSGARWRRRCARQKPYNATPARAACTTAHRPASARPGEALQRHRRSVRCLAT